MNEGQKVTGTNQYVIKTPSLDIEVRDEYAKMLVEKGKIDDVDTISGATVNYKEFVEAVNLALDEAAIQSVEHVFNWRKYLEDMRKDPHWNDKKACKSRRSCGKDPYDIEDPT